MPLITISKGGPTTDIADGPYPVVLTALTGPKRIYPANAGPEGAEIFEWTFDAEGVELQGTTSKASGPKSKMFEWITALQGGKAPADGQSFEATDLVGSSAIAQVGHSEGGWPRVEKLMAIPKSMREKQFAAATGTPTAAPKGQPARAALNTAPSGPIPELADEPPADDLPF